MQSLDLELAGSTMDMAHADWARLRPLYDRPALDELAGFLEAEIDRQEGAL